MDKFSEQNIFVYLTFIQNIEDAKTVSYKRRLEKAVKFVWNFIDWAEMFLHNIFLALKWFPPMH